MPQRAQRVERGCERLIALERRRGRALSRQHHDEHAAALRAGLDPDAPPVRLGDVLDEREPDTAAAHLAPVRDAPTHEALENSLTILGRDAGALVGHADLDLAAPIADGDRNAATIGRVLEGVVDEVDDGNLDGTLVAADRRQPWLHVELDLDALPLGAQATSVHRARHHLADRPVREVVGLPPPLHLGEVEHVLDQRGQALALAHDDLQVLPALLVAVDAPALQELTEHAHERKRRLELVRNVGDEVALQVRELALASRRHDDDDETQNHDEARETHEHHFEHAPALHRCGELLPGRHRHVDGPLVERGLELAPQRHARAGERRAEHDAPVGIDHVDAALLCVGVERGKKRVHDARHVVPHDHQVAAAFVFALPVAAQVGLAAAHGVQVT